MRYFGTIEVTNDKIRVSDPGYKPDTWCNTVITDALSGKYDCYYIEEDNCIAELRIYHESVALDTVFNENYSSSIGVDSGLCGFYDEDYFQQININAKTKNDWYDKIYKIENFDVLDKKCCITSSGYGDGVYDCYVHRNDSNKIDAAGIVFMYEDIGDNYDD